MADRLIGIKDGKITENTVKARTKVGDLGL
jgi:hypothetical protein